MRRLFLAFSEVLASHGGIQRFNRLLCRALEELSPSLELDLHAFSLEPPSSGVAGVASPASFPFEACGGQLALARRVLQECARRRPHGLLVGHVGMSPIGVVSAPFVRRGFALVAHGAEAWSIPRRSRRLGARRARLVLSVSEFTGRELCREAGVDPKRVRLLPNTIDPAMEAADADSAESETGGIELLSVGRLDETERRKGIDHTITALSTLRERLPDLRLRIVGSGGDRSRLVDLARATGVSERIRFEEGLSDSQLVERYRRCSAFVLPSSQEGFGIVFLEAMRFGKACIGAREGGIPEVIDDGVTGLLVPFADVPALARAVELLATDPKARDRMGEAGRERFRSTFAYPRFRERVEIHVREWLGT